MEMNSLQLPAARPLNGSRAAGQKRRSGSMEDAQGDAVAPSCRPWSLAGQKFNLPTGSKKLSHCFLISEAHDSPAAMKPFAGCRIFFNLCQKIQNRLYLFYIFLFFCFNFTNPLELIDLKFCNKK